MGGSRWVVVLSVGVLLMIPAASCDDSPEDGGTLTAYGKACQAALGQLPLHWNCQDGAVLSVGLPAGTLPGAVTSTTTCDNPPWLTLGGNSGQCKEGARLLKVATTDAGGAATKSEVRVICRRYKAETDPVKQKFYQDVAVVATNPDTGDTCFFQALGDALDGTNVPSPMADPSSANLDERRAGKEALKFWLKPEALSNGALRCSSCHDNDAWMHTPYVDQITDGKNQVPDIESFSTRSIDTFTKGALNHADPYQLVMAPVLFAAGWPSPTAIRTAKVKDDNGSVDPQKCTECHRISGSATRTGMKDTPFNGWITLVTDGNQVTNRTQRDLTDAAQWAKYASVYHYMPESVADADEGSWHKSWDKHIKALRCCTDDPTKYGCASYPIFGVKPGDMLMQGMNKMNKCIDDTGDVSLYMSIQQATAKRVAGNNRCDADLSQDVCVDLTVMHTLVDGTSQIKTMDENGLPLGYCAQNSIPHRSDTQIFPADVVDLKLSDTLAWDSSHVPLMFQKWVSASGDPKDCPCEDPTSTTCHFTSKGASDWFGSNGSEPTFDGDPPQFVCQPQFVPMGTCQDVCDANTHEGTDAPETHQVEMGKSSGTFNFSWQMYTIKDQMVVSYAGTQLYDTGCVSDGGSATLSYSGTSTQITVAVTPNCEGSSGTVWDFTVGCPQ